jgi:MFS family permease
VPYRGFLGAVFVFGVGDFARTLLILHATQLLTPSLGATRAAATAMGLYVLHNAVYAAASYPVGAVADRVRPGRLLVLGYVAGTATALLAAFSTASVPFLGLMFVAGGLTLAFEDTLEGTIAATEVPPELRGSGFAWPPSTASGTCCPALRSASCGRSSGRRGPSALPRSCAPAGR